MNLSEIVNSELKRKYHLKESVDKIINETDEQKRFHHIVEYLDEMINNGYNEEMMETELDEGLGDFFSNVFGGVGNMITKGGGGLFSQAKEWLIMQFLGFIGFTGPLAEAFATALSEMSPADLISVFRGRESCKRHGATVADALSEAIVTYILQSTRGNSIAANFIKNTLFEYVKQSNFGESAANFLCNAAYNVKQKASGQIQPTITKINKPTPSIS